LTLREATPADPVRYVLRLLDEDGNLWVEREALPHGGRMDADTRDTLADRQGFFVPPDAPPGPYVLEIAAFERHSQNPAPLAGGSNQAHARLDVLAPLGPTFPPRIPIPHALAVPVGDVQFLGYGLASQELRGGDRVELSGWWQGITSPSHSFVVELTAADGEVEKLYEGPLVPNSSGEYQPQQIVRTRHQLTLPPQAAAGYARLQLLLDGHALPPIRLPLGESVRRFRVPIITRPQLTLVGDAIQLLGYKLDRTQYRAGESIPLTLYWVANDTPPASYKVFVQLLDANGVLRAQRDAMPKNDTLPTDRWFPGEYISDDYALNLPSDLAPGEYRIIVGMYLEASGERVPLKDANSAPLPDNAVTLADRIQVQ
jgi:hypothetical protein